jgi:hypothetical protein
MYVNNSDKNRLFNRKKTLHWTVIKSSCILLQIGGNQPLGAGANPTKFGVNRPTISMFAKSRFCKIAILAK